MSTHKEFLPVNWVDGMKINKNHFISQQHASTYQQAISSSCLLNNHNYGLLPATNINQARAGVWLNADNQQHVQVRVMECRAVTRGGYPIAFHNDTALDNSSLSARIPGLSVPFSDLAGKQNAYYIVLSINPYERVPSGAANPEEVPARLPYTTPAYSVMLLPVAETNMHSLGSFQLPVGKVHTMEQRVMLDESYIPPCVAVNSHVVLLEAHASLEQFYGRMELNAVQIIQKILQKKQQNDLSEPVQRMCENMLVYIANVYTQLKLEGLYAPPVTLVSGAAGFARIVKNTLDLYTGTIREELLNYFAEWCGIKQTDLEDSVTALCNYQYDHLDIYAGVDKVLTFSAVALKLFNTLAALDYIGKKKEAGIFVKEQVIVPEEEVQMKKRRSFLAD
ncbi:Predicted component of the type VI protein secretion system [Filimonas lacunae]|uniref:Predicted component of the type VI protein secretion system n=1 Tax=Filimonas lacunae TaxID=477680 RepID=A0A173MRQ4_9BACT|nr:hypothetical protein [Filimonas lacunae]BAV10177.1 hypothetical protein FLA_6237 [Filimonas lacunae]SIT18580.1 Predicted component of the type VI protein secretion system [Filimonas lacunae]